MVLSHGLGAFVYRVLRKLPREYQSDGGLNLARTQGLRFSALAEVARFLADACEVVDDEGVHYCHRAAGDSDVGVDLLQDAVNVRYIFLRRAGRFLVLADARGCLLGGLLGDFLLGGHLVCEV